MKTTSIIIILRHHRPNGKGKCRIRLVFQSLDPPVEFATVGMLLVKLPSWILNVVFAGDVPAAFAILTTTTKIPVSGWFAQRMTKTVTTITVATTITAITPRRHPAVRHVTWNAFSIVRNPALPPTTVTATDCWMDASNAFRVENLTICYGV